MTDPAEPPLTPETPPASPPGLPPPIAPPLVPPDLTPATADAPASPVPPPPDIPLVPTRRLLATSFDLLLRSNDAMRRASFYAGAITLGTVGPLVLAALILEREGVIDESAAFSPADAGAAAVLLVLVCIAFAGLLVAIIEGRNIGVAVLGSRMVGRPVSTRQALARSRRIFWASVAVALLVGIIVRLAQWVAEQVFGEVLLQAPEIGVIVSTAVGAVVGAPFAYTLAGVVLGDVGPLEAMRRSLRVFGVRRAAAFLIVLFESIAVLLVLLGLDAGLGLVLRVVETLGLGPDAGPLGLAVTVVGVVAIVFALGTLLFTVFALTAAPQVVMFLGLTHATYGLDRVRSGGRDDPDAWRSRGRRGWFSAGMILAFIVAAVGLAIVVAYALA